MICVCDQLSQHAASALDQCASPATPRALEAPSNNEASDLSDKNNIKNNPSEEVGSGINQPTAPRIVAAIPSDEVES